MRASLARPAAVLLVVLGLAILAGRTWPRPRSAAELQVRGLVTSVEPADIGHAKSFTLRAADGRELRFAADPAMDMTPGHMREHMTFGQAVTVHYRRAGDQLVASSVTD